MNRTGQDLKIYFTLAALFLTIIHFAVLMGHFVPAISTPDANGYFVQARLIANEGRTAITSESAVQYIGPHWLYGKDRRYYTTFPPGFPLLLAGIYKIFGYKATLYINPIMASLSLLGFFLLGRRWIGAGWALLALVLLAVNATANEHALFGDSHTSVLFFLTYGLHFFTLWTKTNSPRFALVSGLCFGMIPTIRYPETLLVLAVVIYIFILVLKKQITWRSTGAGAIGVFLPMAALLVRNQLAFGAFWHTGYGLSTEPAHFGWHYFFDYSLTYLEKLVTDGIGLIFIIGIIGIILLIRHKNSRGEGVLFVLLIIPITLLYMSYCWQPDPQSMRFLLPTFPIYIIAGTWLLQILEHKHRKLAIGFAVVVLVISVVLALPRSIRAMQHLRHQNSVLATITSSIEAKVEPGSVIISYEGILQHLDVVGRWRLIDAVLVLPTWLRRAYEIRPAKPKPIRNIDAKIKYDSLTGPELFNAFARDIRQWAGNERQVYLLLKERPFNWLQSQLPASNQLEIMAKIELPRVRNRHHRMPPGHRWQPEHRENRLPSRRLMAPNQIFDLVLDGEPLWLIRWKI